MTTETSQTGGFASLLEEWSLGRVAYEMARRKNWLVVAASTGAILGALASIWGPPRAAEATAVYRDTLEYAFSAVQLPEIFNLTQRDVMLQLGRELALRSHLESAVDSIKSDSADIFTAVPKWTLDSRQIKLRLDGVVAKRGTTEETVASYRVGLTGTHPRVGAAILSRLSELAHTSAKAKLMSNRKSVIDLEIARATYLISATRSQSKNKALLEQELRAVRLELKEKREYLIATLKEALQVATAVGLDKPSPAIFANDPSKGRSQQNFDTKNVPLFLLGSEALKEQIKVLEGRRQDDHEDERVSEIVRDLDILNGTPEGEAVRVRGDAIPLDATYLNNIRRLKLLKQIDAVEPTFQLLEVEQPPSPGEYSDVGNMLWNILRGFLLGLIAAVVIALGALALQASLPRPSRPA